MKKYLIFIITSIIISCSLEKKDSNKLITKAIPTNSELIIKFHNIDKIYQEIQTFEWWEQLKNTELFYENLNLLDKLNKDYQIEEFFLNQNTYLSARPSIGQKIDFLFITSISDMQIKSHKLMRTINSSLNKPRNYEGVQINNIESHANIYFAYYENIFLLSLSSILIEESIRKLKSDQDIFQSDPIEKLSQNLPKYSDINIILKTPLLERIIGHKNIFLKSDTWSWFDAELTKNSIILNGVTNRGEVTYLSNSEYSDAKKSNIENILPRHITGFYKYQINNYSDLNEVINTISKGAHKNIYHLSDKVWFPEEINIAYNDEKFANKSYIVCKASNINEAVKFLNNSIDSEKYNYLNFNILKLKSDNNSINWINQILTGWNHYFFCTIGDYIIFSNSIKKIKSLINNTISNQTIGKNKSIQTINQKLGNKSHTLFYLNFQETNKEWKQIFNSIVAKNTASKEYFFNSIILLHQNQTFQNPTLWSVNLDAETNYKPQIVVNHYSQDKEIITQDIENNIYLINNNGQRLWKKNIGNSIIGDIHQIDAFKNKKLQYLFNTKDSIYLIDRNGKHVNPFPIKSENTMTTPIAVFDYDNNRDYRILAPMKNRLSMYNHKGEIVSGWEFLQTSSNIIMPPEHYQLFNKDYIIISEEDGSTYLLNRKGQIRNPLKSKIYRSKKNTNLIIGSSLNDSKLIVPNTQGELISIYFNGEIDTLKIQNFKKQDEYISNNNYTIQLKDKKLTFLSKENQFEYIFKIVPNSKPKIFHTNESIVIGVRNESENLIYLFNEHGGLYQKPFFGTTKFSIGKMDQSDNINLIVGSSEGLIYNYQVN
ncbi:MAG: hypothetical protein CMD26_05925 [Flavobacteriales bacterium]|nr:hypothetical protein [Flavobacteriales bacterium]|tara:strand:+ start:2320 stop:4797 length:2478 start_codon:yes stop_codon:yes gene_type:complete